MITLPKEFSEQISEFAPLFSKKVFEHAKVLLSACLEVIIQAANCRLWVLARLIFECISAEPGRTKKKNDVSEHVLYLQTCSELALQSKIWFQNSCLGHRLGPDLF